jgi:N-sulfoglucosamine sulfohydrolase
VNPQRSRPNIVLIHGHDLGRYLGTYGRPVATPHLDRLASEGLRFDRYFCPAPQCSPSRASMMTGLYPSNNGMLGLAHLGWSLHRPELALPKQLTENGYRTLLFGEQHEAEESAQLGYQASRATAWPQLASVVARAFADDLPGLPRDRPFFASIGFFEAHRPFDHPGYEDDLPDDIPVPPYLPDDQAVRADLGALHGRVRALDEGVGTVLRALHDAGLAQDTLVIFTTDHGLALPRAKGTLYDSGLEAAFVARWPGSIRPGESRRELLCNVDLAPTLLEVAGIDPADGLDGVSFLPLLRGEAARVRDHFFCQMTWHDRYAPMRGIRTERWKYIRHFGPRSRLYLPGDVEESPSGREFRRREPARSLPEEELYDMREDPHELVDLGDDQRFAGITAELRERLESWTRESGDPLPRRHEEWLRQSAGQP